MEWQVDINGLCAYLEVIEVMIVMVAMILDPLKEFENWFHEAQKAGIPLAESMALATVGRDGRPHVRMVLLKEVSAGGFVFFTNYESPKSKQIKENPFASLLFHWSTLEKQIRIEGSLLQVSRQESEAYFRTRPRDSQLGAWASAQSSVIESREKLEAQLEQRRLEFEGKEVPCPPHWGGFRLTPDVIEFWKGRPNRLHDRLRYSKNAQAWSVDRLSP